MGTSRVHSNPRGLLSTSETGRQLAVRRIEAVVRDMAAARLRLSELSDEVDDELVHLLIEERRKIRARLDEVNQSLEEIDVARPSIDERGEGAPGVQAPLVRRDANGVQFASTAGRERGICPARRDRPLSTCEGVRFSHALPRMSPNQSARAPGPPR